MSNVQLLDLRHRVEYTGLLSKVGVFQGTTQEELGKRFEHGFKRAVIEETILDLKSDDGESEDKQGAGWRRSGQVNREGGVGKGAGRLRDDGQAE